MAKLHSEKRIKAVNTGASEDGDPTLFEEGDVVYSSVDNQFKRKTGALGAGGWDAIAGGGSGEENVQADWNESDNASDAFIQNKPTIPSTLTSLSDVDPGPADGQIIKWNNAAGRWEPQDETPGPADTDALPEGSTNFYFTAANRTLWIAGVDLGQLEDVYYDTGQPTNGQILKYNASNNRWECETEAAATQADWAEVNGADPSFIQNKPVVPSVLSDLSNVSSAVPANGQVLKWNNTSTEWEPGSSAAGSAASSFTFDDHLIPDTNAAYDLGNAEYKIRHLFLSDNSLWVGDAGKISVANDTIRIIKRKKSKWPSGIPHSTDNVNTLRGYDASYNTLPNEEPLDPNKDWSIVSLQHWVQLSKSLDASNTIDTVYPAGEASNFEYPEGDAVLGLSPMSPTAPSTSIVRSFDVVVASKDNDRYPEGGGSGNAFYVDGHHAPEMRLKRGTYRFYQIDSSNNSHKFVFRPDNSAGGMPDDATLQSLNINLLYGYVNSADGSSYTAASWDGNTWTNSLDAYTPSNWGPGTAQPTWLPFVDITIKDNTPREFFYACHQGGHIGMGWKIINEEADLGGGPVQSDWNEGDAGADSYIQNKPIIPSVIGDLSNVSAAAAVNGQALVWNVSNAQFEPENILDNNFAAVHESNIAGDEPIHSPLKNNYGGRIVYDNIQAGGQVFLDLAQFDGYSMVKTMNFEIYHRNNQTFTVEIRNTAGSIRELRSHRITYDNYTNHGIGTALANDNVYKIELDNGDVETITINPSQMLVMYCDGTYWYHELRAI